MLSGKNCLSEMIDVPLQMQHEAKRQIPSTSVRALQPPFYLSRFEHYFRHHMKAATKRCRIPRFFFECASFTILSTTGFSLLPTMPMSSFLSFVTPVVKCKSSHDGAEGTPSTRFAGFRRDNHFLVAVRLALWSPNQHTLRVVSLSGGGRVTISAHLAAHD